MPTVKTAKSATLTHVFPLDTPLSRRLVFVTWWWSMQWRKCSYAYTVSPLKINEFSYFEVEAHSGTQPLIYNLYTSTRNIFKWQPTQPPLLIDSIPESILTTKMEIPSCRLCRYVVFTYIINIRWTINRFEEKEWNIHYLYRKIRNRHFKPPRTCSEHNQLINDEHTKRTCKYWVCVWIITISWN